MLNSKAQIGDIYEAGGEESKGAQCNRTLIEGPRGPRKIFFSWSKKTKKEDRKSISTNETNS